MTSRPEYWQAEAPPQPGYSVTGPGGYEYHELSGEYGYDRPLPCCGCGIGWFLFIFGFFFNLLWYVGAILWFFPHNPRERPGLTASLVAGCISAAFALGIVAYFVSDRDHIMALWADYRLGQPVLDS
ncbi:hypothetical protein KFL_002910180 [Klebsormidium nitens]|uniref:Uncharacterized protein n=1 Tax=Klebsormidium nitens TaxID=105231 RepID=A0A1Y1I6A4_KLENI|nr:hypothetical protein KFL_002910180 [Klebsormidium nitens]|eukprot:GAQ86480.1 hypothetical protein KFL_002910180 [Klebsormidium nitens]